MEKQLARLVNRGMAGESEHISLQNLETNQLFDFVNIKFVNENDSIRDVEIAHNDLSHSDIQRILNNGHEIHITYDESNNVTLHF